MGNAKGTDRSVHTEALLTFESVAGGTEKSVPFAAEIIRRGGLVAFPTETVYGLGANALDCDAVARIYAVKCRPLASPLIVHVADEAMARTLVADWPERAHELALRFWPGPLTLVLKKACIVPDVVTAGLDSVGVRVPAHPIALELIRQAGVPIAAPSANRFTEISPTTAAHVRESLGDAVDMILDGGPTQVGIESTVASLRRDPPVVLRPGMISQQQLEEATGVRWEREEDVPRIMESPGQHARHYAPRTPFHVLASPADAPAGRGRILEMPANRESYAANLYAALRLADKEGWDWIAVIEPPDLPEWTGIRDRLRRAST
jgi:L-threonylcarbamoyladenylate synthase